MRNTQETFSKDIALSKHTEQILVLLPKEITQKLDNISERISRHCRYLMRLTGGA